jgi:ABC-type phosphate transport system substrate-binding protein
MRRRLNKLLLLSFFLLCGSPATHAGIVVIVHPDNPVQSLTPGEVSDFYMARNRSLKPYDLPDESFLREKFFHSLNGISIKRLNAYWARLRYSGEMLPPTPLPDSRAVVEAVSRNKQAIGYVDAAALNTSVKAVLHMKE